ncbi:MAG: transcriptional regulator [Chloroflexi bacterium]|jgi:LacI family transcriptional regulator|nr:transcriptional regulator [Chloroflexota bacterium]
MPTRLTISDIARKAGVSKTTVSRVLNNRPDVEDKTRSHVLNIIEENNYVPSPIAVGYVKNKTHLIGLVSPAEMHSWQIEVFQGVVAGLKDYNYQLLLLPHYPDEAAESSKEFDRILNNGLADGLIVLHPSLVQSYFQKLSNAELPVVAIDDASSLSNLAIPSIGANNYTGALQAVRHLIGLGHRKIAFIGANNNFRFTRDRLDGYKAAHTQAGLVFNPDFVKIYDEDIVNFRFLQEQIGYKSTLALLAQEKPLPSYTAIFAETDEMAIGVMRALNEHGLRIPDDISLVGFDDLPKASYTTPALTTVHQPTREMGKMVVKLLMDMIDGKIIGQKRHELDTEVIIRASTRAI